MARLWYFTESPTVKIKVQKNSGFKLTTLPNFKDFSLKPSSAVYIGKRIVLTAAHCIPMYISDGKYIGNMDKHFYFNISGKGTFRILKVKIHPVFEQQHALLPLEKQKDRTTSNMVASKHDIAILLLEDDVQDLPGAELVDASYLNKTDNRCMCNIIGYSDRRNENHLSVKEALNEMSILDHFMTAKTAGFVSSWHISSDNLQVVAPYLSTIQDIYNLDPIKYGMSGGGWFTLVDGKLKLLAISTTIIAYEDDLLADRKDRRAAAIMLCAHKDWLDKTIESLLNKIPAIDALQTERHKQRKEYENAKCLPTSLQSSASSTPSSAPLESKTTTPISKKADEKQIDIKTTGNIHSLFSACEKGTTETQLKTNNSLGLELRLK